MYQSTIVAISVWVHKPQFEKPYCILLTFTFTCHSPLAWILSHVQCNATTTQLYICINSHILLTFAVCCLSAITLNSFIYATQCEWWQLLPQGHNMRLPTHPYPVPRLSTSRAVTHWPCISSQNAQGQINLHLLLIKCYFNNTSGSSPTDGQYYAQDTMAKVVKHAWNMWHTHRHTQTLLSNTTRSVNFTELVLH